MNVPRFCRPISYASLRSSQRLMVRIFPPWRSIMPRAMADMASTSVVPGGGKRNIASYLEAVAGAAAAGEILAARLRLGVAVVVVAAFLRSAILFLLAWV